MASMTFLVTSTSETIFYKWKTKQQWNHLKSQISGMYIWLHKLFCPYFVAANTYHIYQPLRSGRIWHKVNFQADFNRFQFRVFPFLDQLPHQGWRNQSALLFTHSWIHTFPKGISAMWNAVSSRIWTRVTVSISYIDNHYTTGTSINTPGTSIQPILIRCVKAPVA